MRLVNERVLRILEYDKITAMLSEHADSSPGKAQCEALQPLPDPEAVRDALARTSDAVSRIFRKGSISFGSNRPVDGILRSLKIGASLTGTELLQLAAMLENAGRVKAYGREETRDALSSSFDLLEPVRQLTEEIRRCILSEDEISPEASPALKHIRRDMTLTTDRIHTVLNQMVNGAARTYLQDAVITMRDDRYCLPVKSEYKGQVKGLVHDSSSTGATLFIEPAQVVELNNRLRELRAEEKEEIRRILKELSESAAEHADEIAADAEILTLLDFVFAKAKLALAQNAIAPQITQDGHFRLIKARHPLIDAGRVVPIDVHMGGENPDDDFSMLVITGPNTGGKTVTLKTVGLLTLMGMSGLMIPAADRSEIAFFKEVYADIGDEQSIEQSLSTFSAHLTNTVQILSRVTSEDLCLFDELGAGTDPTEGAALAISILDDLHAGHIRTMATTHYSELKVYAMTTRGVRNASCEFDVASLKPTYRLLIGLPGKSNAFAISEKLGLPKRIIDAAKSQVGEDAKRFEGLIADLEESRRIIEQERLQVAQYKEEIEALKNSTAQKQKRFDARADEIIENAEEEAREILQEAKETADATIRNMRRASKNVSMQDLERERTRLNETIAAQNAKAAERNKKKKAAAAKPHPGIKVTDADLGATVRIVPMDLTGTIHSKPDKKGNVSVMCGSMRMETNLKDLELIPEEKSAGKQKTVHPAHTMDLSRASSISAEVNLIGMNSDDAIHTLSKYLDDAYLAHLANVRVVHGKGEGILRRAVQQYLKKVKYVKSFQAGEYGEGDSGVTVVTFR